MTVKYQTSDSMEKKINLLLRCLYLVKVHVFDKKINKNQQQMKQNVPIFFLKENINDSIESDF